MTEVVEHIPMLTDIVKAGDPGMLNHFDAHQFDISAEKNQDNMVENSLEDDLQSIIDVSNIIENASSSENIDFEIPSIKFDTEEQADVPDKIFSNEENLNSKAIFNETSDTNEIKEKIDKAVKTLLPAIEKQLKEQLYKEFDI